jgi:hypothetical protein
MTADFIVEDRDRRPVMKADIIAEDRDGRPVLLVEVKGDTPSDAAVSRFLDILTETPESIAFGMLVDPKTIRVYRRGERFPVAEFDAVEILRYYFPEYTGEPAPYGHRLLFKFHVRTLTGSWLSDLAYRWKTGQPPMLQELEAIGLLSLIDVVTTEHEVPIGGHSLR